MHKLRNAYDHKQLCMNNVFTIALEGYTHFRLQQVYSVHVLLYYSEVSDQRVLPLCNYTIIYTSLIICHGGILILH